MHEEGALYFSRSVFDAEKTVIRVSIWHDRTTIWRERYIIVATVGLHRRRGEIIRRLIGFIERKIGPQWVKHAFSADLFG